MDKGTRLLITILVAVIIILLLVVGYTFVVKPTINGYVVNGQTQGYQLAVAQIMQAASTCQPVPLFYNNQTITVVSVECLQAAQALQAQAGQ